MCVHVRACRHVCVDLKQIARGGKILNTYIHVFIYAYVYIYNCAAKTPQQYSAAKEVECPTRQVTQEDTLRVCIIICPHVYTRPYLICERGIRAERQERRHRARQALFTGLV